MSDSPMFPRMTRVWWYDKNGEYHSITKAHAAANALFVELRRAGLRVGQKPIW